MADLLLDETPVGPVLGQVRDVGMPLRVHRKRPGQPQRVPVGSEPGVDLRRLDPPAPLSDPQRRVTGEPEPRADVLDVVGDRLHRPAHHRQHFPPPRRLSPLRLAVADVQRAVTAEPGCPRVAAEVGHVQPGRLSPAQPPPVDHLKDRRVAVGCQGALAPGPHRPLNLLISVVHEPLQLLAGERPRLRPALVVVQARDRVPLVADRHRMPPRTERLLARCRPPVARRWGPVPRVSKASPVASDTRSPQRWDTPSARHDAACGIRCRSLWAAMEAATATAPSRP